ncbi:MAG: PLP-dependent aminotransferase family protein [Clostridium sp.]|nr:PLP-dependent aminotransferase family protein [Clostridium sp.]
MEKFLIEFNEYEPKYIQIANNIKKLVNDKCIEGGEKLPTIRALAKFLGVNNDTIVSCYKRLVNDGYAVQKVGSGTYVKKRDVIAPFKREYSKEIKAMISSKDEDIIDFTGESNREVIFPIDEFKEVINKVLDRDGAEALIHQESLGYMKLRQTINEAFWKGKRDIDDLLIVSGAQQGIDIASKAMLNINDNVIVEKPTYIGALSVFKWRRANIFEIPIEEDGINIEQFEKILKKHKIKFFYTMSYFHNPTGISYSREKKIKILELAKIYDFYIIEDDYLSELIYDNNLKHEPFKKLDIYDRVVYIKSFSKVFLPGIRLGYIINPKAFRDVMMSSKVNTDIATSTLMQRSLEMYIKEGYWKGYISFLKNEYKIRYDLMKKLLEEELKEYVSFIDPKGGLTFYSKLKNKEIDSEELFYRLKKRKLYITPGSIFYTGSQEGHYTFRVRYSQVKGEDIRRGINIIKEELGKCRI